MSSVAIVWLAVGLTGLVLGLIFTVALVRHMVLIGRAVARFVREAADAGAGPRMAGPDR